MGLRLAGNHLRPPPFDLAVPAVGGAIEVGTTLRYNYWFPSRFPVGRGDLRKPSDDKRSRTQHEDSTVKQHSPSYSTILRLRYPDLPGLLGQSARPSARPTA